MQTSTLENQNADDSMTVKAVGCNALVSCFSGGASELVFLSFRYFMGRMTIATCCFADELAKAWPLLDKRTQTLIREELDKAFAKDDEMRADPVCSSHYYPLGMDCDRAHWEKVRSAYTANDQAQPRLCGENSQPEKSK